MVIGVGGGLWVVMRVLEFAVQQIGDLLPAGKLLDQFRECKPGPVLFNYPLSLDASMISAWIRSRSTARSSPVIGFA